MGDGKEELSFVKFIRQTVELFELYFFNTEQIKIVCIDIDL